MPLVAAKFVRFSLAGLATVASIGLGIRAGLPAAHESAVVVATEQSPPPPTTSTSSPGTPVAAQVPAQPPAQPPAQTTQTTTVPTAPPALPELGPPGIADIDLGVPIAMPWSQAATLPGVYAGPGALSGPGPGAASYQFINVPGAGPSPQAPRYGLPGAAVAIYSGKCAGSAPNSSYTCVGGVWAPMWPGGSSNLSTPRDYAVPPDWVTPGTCASPSPGPTYKCVNGGWILR